MSTIEDIVKTKAFKRFIKRKVSLDDISDLIIGVCGSWTTKEVYSVLYSECSIKIANELSLDPCDGPEIEIYLLLKEHFTMS